MRGSETKAVEERFDEATVPILVKVMKKGGSSLVTLEVISRLLPPLAVSIFSVGREGVSLQTFAG